LRRKEGETLVHLLNTTAMQVAGEYATVDFVPPAGPVALAVQGAKPRGAKLEPDGAALEWRRAGSEWRAVIPRLELHSVAVMVR
jgi:hypothetical protein